MKHIKKFENENTIETPTFGDSDISKQISDLYSRVDTENIEDITREIQNFINDLNKFKRSFSRKSEFKLEFEK